MEQFCIHFHEKKQNDLQHRIDSTRFPKPFLRENWDLGVDDGYLSSLLDYWRYDYDWSRKEAELNRYPQFTCNGTKKTLRVPIYIRFSQPLFDINNLLILKQFSRSRNCNNTAIFRTWEHILDTKIAYFFLFQSDIECSFADAFPSKFSFCYKLTK